MSKLSSTLKELYVGKEFIYKSKYGGRPQGTCTDINISNRFILDEETTELLKNIKNHLDKIEYKRTPTVAHQPHIHVVSENGNIYDFEDCYFLNTDISFW